MEIVVSNKAQVRVKNRIDVKMFSLVRPHAWSLLESSFALLMFPFATHRGESDARSKGQVYSSVF